MTRSFVSVGANAVLAVAVAVAVQCGTAKAQDRKVTLALSSLGTAQAYAFVAQAEGFWKDQGLDVDWTVMAGQPAQLALITGGVQFSQSGGTDILQFHSKGQKMLAIADIENALPNEIVLRKDVADKTGLTVAKSTVEQRAKALKGLTISDDGASTPPDVFLRYALRLAGLTPENDVTVATIPASGSNVAMEAKRVDAFSETQPFSTMAVQKGTGVLWISAPRGDINGLSPAAQLLLTARPDYCASNPADCKAMATGIRRALQFIHSNPQKSIEDVGQVLKTMDPELLKSSYPETVKLMSPDGKISDPLFTNIQNYSIAAGVLTQAQALTKFEGEVYTNEYLQ